MKNLCNLVEYKLQLEYLSAFLLCFASWCLKNLFGLDIEQEMAVVFSSPTPYLDEYSRLGSDDGLEN